MRERWRNIRRAPGYRVSSYGRIRSPGGPLYPFPDKDGYLRVTLRGEQVQVSHLVLEAFDRPRPYGLEARHGDLGNQVNSFANLCWGTRLENARDKLRAHRNETGVSPPNSPVTPVTSDVP